MGLGLPLTQGLGHGFRGSGFRGKASDELGIRVHVYACEYVHASAYVLACALAQGHCNTSRVISLLKVATCMCMYVYACVRDVHVSA